MRRLIVMVVIAGSASCASSGSPPSNIAMPSERVVAVDNHGVLRTTVAPNAKAPIPAPPARAFDALRAVYISLMSVARADGKGATELETAFAAQARNMEGTAGERIPAERRAGSRTEFA